MPQRYHFAHFILVSVVVLGLTPLVVVVDAQAQIVFASNRHGSREIYVMDADGKNLRNLTNHPDNDYHPSWYRPSSGVAPAGKVLTVWGRLKQVDR